MSITTANVTPESYGPTTFEVSYVPATDTDGSAWEIHNCKSGDVCIVPLDYAAGIGSDGKIAAIVEAWPYTAHYVIHYTGDVGDATLYTAVPR